MTSPAVISPATSLERQKLVARAKAGDVVALADYRNLNRGLEEQIIQRYAGYVSKDEIQDLRQEGLIGLLKGIASYDPNKKAGSGKPEGYIYSWVRAYISGYARTYGRAKLGIEITELVNEDGGFFDVYETLEDENVEPADDRCSRQDQAAVIRRTISKLPKKERVITKNRLMSKDRTLSDLGKELGISRERVRQLETSLKTKLQKRLHEKLEIDGISRSI